MRTTTTARATRVTVLLAAVAMLLLLGGIASATDETLVGIVNDNTLAHYHQKRCATIDVRFNMKIYPDGDDMDHFASRNDGGGDAFGTRRFRNDNTDSQVMGPHPGDCFYWNSRQYEGIFEFDRDDTWSGELHF